MNVRFSPRSLKDLDDIRAYIERDNPRAAWVVASFIKRSIALLQDWPYHGRATDTKDVRRQVVMNYPYVVYYRVTDHVLILTVQHSARN